MGSRILELVFGRLLLNRDEESAVGIKGLGDLGTGEGVVAGIDSNSGNSLERDAVRISSWDNPLLLLGTVDDCGEEASIFTV